MARFGEFKAQFFARDDLNTPLSDGVTTVRVPVSGETSAVMNGMGRTELTFGYDALIGALIAEGNICICYQYDSLIADPYVGGTPFCLPFKIESITPVGPGLIRIEGPDLLDELLNTQHFSPIGAGTETNTTVATAVDDPGTTTLAVGAPHNNLSAAVVTTNGWQEGDEIRITMDNGGVHVSTVWRVLTSGGPYPHILDFTDRMPADAAIGNTVERRRRLVEVASNVGAFQVGVECRLTLDNGSVHTTIIEEEPDGNIITMRDGAPDGAAVGKAVKATDYSEPTTYDVTKIMAYMVGWTSEFESGYSGTAAGTHHAPMGESVYDLLVATAKATGEFFRLKTPGVGAAPKRTVVWRNTHDTAGQGGTLRLVQPTQANIDSDAANVNRGIITGDVEREGIFRPVTRVVPLAGDKRISLAMCSEEARLQAMVEGLTLVDSGLGLYTPPYLYNAAAEAELGMIARTVTFSQIRAETDSAMEWISAADQLMRAAIAYLYEHGTGVRYRYTVPGIVAAVPVQPGQRVEMVYASPDGRWSVNATGSEALYVLEVRAEFAPPEEDVDGNLNDLGKLVTLVLVESPWDIPDATSAAAAAIAEVGRVARVAANGSGAAGPTTIIMGGGGGEGGDHGELTGLADDDHPQYLRADGTRALAGNLAVNSGITIDGVDLSAHAANADAHHSRASAFDASLAFVGGSQAVRVKPGTNSGLTVDESGLIVALPANSGLVLAAAGLALGTPGSLTVATANAVSGAGHTHEVTGSANVSAGTAALLESDAEGGLALGRLAVGVATDTSATAFFQAKANDDRTVLLKQKSGQTAELWRVEDVAGNALIRLTGGGDLESGYPGFVSRVSGWQIEHGGNAEFNNVFIRGELHATTFVADEMHATGGTLAVMTAAKVAAPASAGQNVLPAVGSTFTLNVQASWDTGLCYFAAGDIVRIKPMGEIASGGSLDLYDIYLQVQVTGSLTSRNLANGNAGYFPMTVYRRNGGDTGFEIPAGCAAVKWAKVNSSGYTGGMILSSDLQYSPYLDIFTIDATQTGATWQSAPVTPIPRVRVGNLRGVLGKSADEWGIAAGTNLSDTSTAARYLVASNAGLDLRNVGIKLYNSGEPTVDIAATGDIKAGTDTASGLTTTFDFTAATGTLRIGPVGAGKPNLYWSGTALQLRQNTTAVISLNGDGSSEFTGPMALGTSGGIWQGDGTFSSPTTGLKLYNVGGIGRLATYNGGNIQTAMDTDGAFKAAWDGSVWNVRLNSDGLSLLTGTVATDEAVITSTPKRVSWNYSGAAVGWVAGRYNTATAAGGMEIIAGPNVSGAGAKFNYRSGVPQTSSVWATGDLRLSSGAGYAVQVLGDFEAQGGAAIDDYITSNGSLFAANGVVVGGGLWSATQNLPGVITLYRRTTHPTNPDNNTAALYLYHNTGAGKFELTLRNANGATVKVAEIAAV